MVQGRLMFNKHPGGKGDRPILPKDQEQFDNNWDTIFKKKKDIPALNESLRTYDGKLDDKK